jgi:hypothetical protein
MVWVSSEQPNQVTTKKHQEMLANSSPWWRTPSICIPQKINRIWLTYQTCLNEIIKQHGGNDYKIPHMDKEKLEREGRLPKNISVCMEGEHWMHEQHPNLIANLEWIQQEQTEDDGSFAAEWETLNFTTNEAIAASSELNN